MQLDLTTIHDADESHLYEIMAAVSGELRRRAIGGDDDGQLVAAVRAVFPGALGLLCDIDTSAGIRTAEPSAVLMPDTVTSIGPFSYEGLWFAICDDVARLARVTGVIIDDPENGPMIRFGNVD